MDLRFRFLAATRVVPEPMKGSRIKSFLLEPILIILSKSLIGFWVGCLTFSLDQGTIGGISIQILESLLFVELFFNPIPLVFFVILEN